MKDLGFRDRLEDGEDEVWNHRDVLKYYSWMKKDTALWAMERVRKMAGEEFYKLSFTSRMNLFRDYLLYEVKVDIEDLPFIVNYRRWKEGE